jgi:hypothetical protein
LDFGDVSKASRYGLGRIADATAIYEARHLAFDLQVAVLFHAADKVIDHGLASQGIYETLGWIARKYTANGNLKAHFGSDDWRAALRALAAAELESLARTVERDEGDFTGQPRGPLLTQKPVPATDPLATRCLGPDSTKTLTEVAVDYIRERKASGPPNNENGNTIRLFNACMGEEKPIFRIAGRDIRAFKDMLAELPLISRAHFPGKTAPEAVAANRARKEPRPVPSDRTINEKYLSRMHAILVWCCKEDLIPDNPRRMSAYGHGLPAITWDFAAKLLSLAEGIR